MEVVIFSCENVLVNALNCRHQNVFSMCTRLGGFFRPTYADLSGPTCISSHNVYTGYVSEGGSVWWQGNDHYSMNSYLPLRPNPHCVVPENIHTPPTDGQWKFPRGGGGGGVKR